MNDLSQRAAAYTVQYAYQGNVRVALYNCFQCQCYIGKCRAETLPADELPVCQSCREQYSYGDRPVLRSEFDTEASAEVLQGEPPHEPSCGVHCECALVDGAPEVNEDDIHYHPGTPHECRPALTVFGDRWVCQYNWCARYLGDAE